VTVAVRRRCDPAASGMRARTAVTVPGREGGVADGGGRVRSFMECRRRRERRYRWGAGRSLYATRPPAVDAHSPCLSATCRPATVISIACYFYLRASLFDHVFVSMANHHLPAFPTTCHVRMIANSEMRFHQSEELGSRSLKDAFPPRATKDRMIGA